MGTWGPTPEESDEAADWFHVMFETTRLANFVRSTLHLDPKENDSQIRAAASVLAALGGIYSWPDTLKDDLKLAISQLEYIKEFLRIEEPGFNHTIDDELASLQARLDAFVA
jgi:hypothetical protein